jgi:dolichol-phosphate mannosyltransferase
MALVEALLPPRRARATTPARDCAIVIAAYNEADNIERVVRGAAQHGRVIVVNDASTDDTAALAERGGATVLTHETNTHIKQAFLDGFRAALDLGARRILQMDAGLSHDPEEIPRLLDALDDADMVIGSRFVPGGRLVNQPAQRRRLSKVGSFLVRAATGMGVADLTSGFKGFRRQVLEALFAGEAVSHIRSRAFAFQFELTHEVHRMGFRIVEVPTTYTATGSSLNRKVVYEALGACARLALRGRSRISAAAQATAGAARP